MDRGEKERDIAKSLRNNVKQTLSVQRLRLSRQTSSTNGTDLAEHVQASHLFDTPSGAELFLKDALDSGFSQEESVSATNLGSAISSFDASPSLRAINKGRFDAIDLILTKESWLAIPAEFEEDQAGLLMHFFDHVLPLQFRFYNPSVLEGGRGWLLSILTRSKPLYHVALSLAAYHQQSILVRESGIPCAASLAKLQERHIECIKVLRRHLEKFPIRSEANSYEDNIEILASVTLVIALEVSHTCPQSSVHH